MRVLITGATGFAGKHLAEHALSHGTEVLAVAIDGAFPAGVMERQADLAEPGTAEELIKEAHPDWVFHLAALVPAGDAKVPLERLIEVNVLATLRVLEAIAHHAAAARTLVVTSASAYGVVPAKRQPITEEMPFNPTTPYALSKAMQDLLAGQYGKEHHLQVVRARTFNQTGPGEQPGLIASTLAHQIAEIEAGLRQPVVSLRYTSTRRDFTDVRDVVRAYWLLLERGRPGNAYNICSGTARSIGDVLHLLLDMAGLSGVKIVERERQRQRGDAAMSWGSAAHLTQDTGWRPQIPLEQSLRDLLDEWRARLRGHMP